MKFRTKWSKAIYIVRPTQRQITALGTVDLRPGLRAIFDRDTHEFDSVKAQEAAGWTDDEREAVEAHLLKSKDYGNGLILMPGQNIPEHLRAVARVDRDEVTSLCTFVEIADGNVIQCQEEALPGKDKCKAHAEKKSQIVKGMLTTTE